METMPAHLVALRASSMTESERKSLSRCGRQVGNKVEVDLGLVEERVSSLVAANLREYQMSCRDFWDIYDEGGSPGEYVSVRYQVMHDKQRDTKTEKRFLMPQLVSAPQVGGLGEYLDELLKEEPSEEALALLGAPLGAHVEQEGHWRTVRLTVETDGTWPLEWGGPGSRAEVRRHVTLRTSHAKSKGRHKERRLVEVSVDAEEIWPSP